MNRRVFIAAGLACAGFGRRVWAQLSNPSPPARYAPLTSAVKIPADAVAQPWQPVSFVAEVSTPRRILISGIVFRTETALSALCITCPHEQCQVDLVTDEERLARMVPRPRSGQAIDKATHPLFECGCHFSVFDAAADGARISGETPRGLYRFRIAGIRDGLVEIIEIEEAALAEV
jgi:Rieske Fe-S protein